MRYVRYLIPLIAFALAMMVMSLIAGTHRSRIRTMINSAGQNGQPIIAVQGEELNPLSTLTLYSLDHGPIPLCTSGNDVSRLDVFFKDDGALFLGGSSFIPLPCLGRRFRFPDYRARPLDEFALRAVTRPYQGDEVYACSDNLRWRLVLGEDALTLEDLVLGGSTVFHPQSIPPWHAPDTPVGAIWENALSPDGSVVITTCVITGSTDPSVFWRYDIEEDSWTRLVELPVHSYVSGVFSVGNAGEVVAIPVDDPSRGRRDLLFLDGSTGMTIVSEPNARQGVLGNRWSACLKTSLSGATEIVLFEMGDNWKRHTISLGTAQRQHRYFGYGRIAMYEPPPNGLDGMYENYDWGNSE